MMLSVTIQLSTHVFTMPCTDSFRHMYARRDNTGVNGLPNLWLKVVLFLIFNEGPFKREREGAIRLATLCVALSFNTMIRR